MKRLLILLFVISVTSIFADDSKLIEVDLDVSTTEIVRVDLDQDSYYYHIDKNACICWVGSKLAAMTGAVASTFSCKKLMAHKKLVEHVKHCK